MSRVRIEQRASDLLNIILAGADPSLAGVQVTAAEAELWRIAALGVDPKQPLPDDSPELRFAIQDEAKRRQALL